MRNFPNIYTSYGPGMPVINGTPGSFVDALKKILVTGTDPVSISGIVVLDGMATITVVVEDQVFLNGARIGIMGCDEPQLNGIFEVDYHDRLTMKFKTTVADGSYGGANLKINQPPAGWTLLFTGTNTAVFVSGNLDSLGVCVKVTDTNALFADIEFFENMTSLTDGVNKWQNAIYNTFRMFRFFKSRNATATKQEYWIATDNTAVHISLERIIESTYTPVTFNGFRGGSLTSWGECEAFNNQDKRNFYFTSPCRTDSNNGAANTYYTDANCFSTGQYVMNSSSTYDFDYKEPYWNGGLLTENQTIGNNWMKLCVYPTFIPGGQWMRMSGGAVRTPPNFKLPSLYLMSDHLVFNSDPFGSLSLNMFGRVKEILYANQTIISSTRNGTKFSHNGKKYILLPIFASIVGVNYANYDRTVMGLVPVLIGEKWG